MNIVLGATGRIGSAIAKHLLKENQPVRAVVHSAGKGDDLKQQGAEIVVADSFETDALRAAFAGGTTVFVLTPESAKSEDVLGETQTILDNYHAALEGSTVKKLIGLSSMGAQFPAGNLEMSYRLERAFTGLDAQIIFVRPAYYFSNWLLQVPPVKESGTLPTFYPEYLCIPMVAPRDVADFIADVMVTPVDGSPVYELEGPAWYSSEDVANALGNVLHRDVKAEQIPRDQWADTLRQAGFTEDAVKNFLLMTELVTDGKAVPEGKGTVKAGTTLEQFLAENLCSAP